MSETAVTIGAWILIIMPIVNTYFVRNGWRVYDHTGRSRIMFSIWVVKLVVWLVGVALAFYAYRYLTDQDPFPFDGLSLVVVLLAIEVLPAYMYIILSSYKDEKPPP